MERKRLTLFLYPWELDSMPEYSTTLPTGTTVGKVWRADKNVNVRGASPEWVVAMYIPDEDPKMVGIVWFNVELRQGPHPRGYAKPDWSNSDQWKRDQKERLAS